MNVNGDDTCCLIIVLIVVSYYFVKTCTLSRGTGVQFSQPVSFLIDIITIKDTKNDVHNNFATVYYII